jgi:hypothetical protein
MGSKDSSLHLTLHGKNGVVDKCNHTITEMAGYMMQNRGVPNKFGVEVVFILTE